MTGHLAGTLVVLAVVVSGCVVSVEDGQVRRSRLGGDSIAVGHDDYHAKCAACHGADARGDGPAAHALRLAPPDLTLLAQRTGGRFPREYVIELVTGAVPIDAHGSRDMPIWTDRFGPKQSGATAVASTYARRSAEAIAMYLESLQR